jgi:hypothetical protein
VTRPDADRTAADDLAEEARTAARDGVYVAHRCPAGHPCADCVADVGPSDARQRLRHHPPGTANDVVAGVTYTDSGVS